MKWTTRRRVLSALAGTVAVGTLAGCGGNGGGDGGDGGGGDTDTPTPTPTPTPTATPTPTPTPQMETVQVGPGGEQVFDPDSLEISPGTTVTFVWGSSGHSLIVDSQPDGADWQGVPETQDEGYEHSHTFEMTGSYEYHCEPHQMFGMEGTITVTE